MLLASALLFGTFNFMPEKFWNRINTIQSAQEDTSFHGRLVAWQVAYKYANDHFPFGAGFYGPQLAQSFTRIFRRRRPHAAHSIYFQVLGEQGYIGLAIYLMIIAGAFWSSARIMRAARGREEFAWAGDLAMMIQMSLIAFCVGGAALSMAYYDLFILCVSPARSLERVGRAATRCACYGHLASRIRFGAAVEIVWEERSQFYAKDPLGIYAASWHHFRLSWHQSCDHNMLRAVSMTLGFMTGTADSNPFFIVGSGRSGTTLLRLILAGHSQIVIPAETWFISPLVAQLPATGPLAPDAVQAAINIILRSYRWPDMEMSDDEFRSRVLRLTRPALADIINVVYGHALERAQRQRIGDKTPPYIFIAPQLKLIFPRAKFINLIRDGRDVAISFVDAGFPGRAYQGRNFPWSSSGSSACGL